MTMSSITKSVYDQIIDLVRSKGDLLTLATKLQGFTVELSPKDADSILGELYWEQLYERPNMPRELIGALTEIGCRSTAMNPVEEASEGLVVELAMTLRVDLEDLERIIDIGPHCVPSLGDGYTILSSEWNGYEWNGYREHMFGPRGPDKPGEYVTDFEGLVLGHVNLAEFDDDDDDDDYRMNIIHVRSGCYKLTNAWMAFDVAIGPDGANDHVFVKRVDLIVDRHGDVLYAELHRDASS